MSNPVTNQQLKIFMGRVCQLWGRTRTFYLSYTAFTRSVWCRTSGTISYTFLFNQFN